MNVVQLDEIVIGSRIDRHFRDWRLVGRDPVKRVIAATGGDAAAASRFDETGP